MKKSNKTNETLEDSRNREVVGGPIPGRDLQAFCFLMKGGPTMTTKERISPVHPFELDIIRKIKENGEIFYDHPACEDEPDDDMAIQVYESHLFDVITFMFERFKTLINLLDPEAKRFTYIGDVLIDASERQLDEIFDILNNKFGRIYCHIVAHGDHFYRTGRIVGITIKKPETKKKVGNKKNEKQAIESP